KTLSSQRLNNTRKVIYNRSGTHIAACVVDIGNQLEINGLPISGFVADSTTHYIETESSDEAYYLVAYLNATSVDDAIKPYQSQGLFGAQSGGALVHERLDKKGVTV
ncbi:hypothetical protein MEO93_29030, partial [Dolichospermum sp. ST_sed3]|nr:hypothetical protein [Dolichospermum sp. ST_sed3]